MRWDPLLPLGWAALLLGPLLLLALVRVLRGPRRGPWALRGVAVLAAVGVALGPVVAREEPGETGVAVDVFFVVDRTGSMAAEDWDGTTPRLDGVRHDVPALTAAVPGARYSVLAWDSEAVRQLPLTTDTRAVGSWAQTVQQEITPYSSGSLLDRPLEALTRAVEGAAERNPSHVRLVFLLSDGEQTTGGERESFEALAELVDGGAVLGYGTAEGGPMRSYDGSLDPDPEAPYITDPSTGEEGVSRLDADALAALAEELGVPYTHRTSPDDVTWLVEDLDPEQIAADGRRTRQVWNPVVWPFAGLIAVVLLGEVWVTARDHPGRRRKEGAS